VISHWLPFLLVSPYFGALADRYDCRKLIQGSQALFMAVSLTWGILFATGTLTVWDACFLLILHGMAGAMWAPPEQLLLEDFVGTADLPSAIRLNSTARSLGVLFGPVVGSALLLGLGPVHGIWVNIAFYLPLTFVAARTRFTGHTRYGFIARQRVGALAAAKVFRDVSKDRVLAVMIILAGLGSFFIGSAMQTVMPTIAGTTTGISSGTAYGLLLFANGLGGVLGGVLLGGTGWIRLSVRAALWSTLVYGASTVLFAVSHDYLVAAPLLVIGGIANLAAMSITQTVAQLRAPRERKGQVMGVYGTGANGMRIGSGLTVGLAGAAIGLRPALALSSAALCACVLALAVYLAAARRFQSSRPGTDALTNGHGI
jgi:MFS family permease